MNTAVLLLAFIVIILAGLWIGIPAAYGLPSLPTRRERIRTALRLAHLQPGETLYDLGCGDGRVLMIAAREFGARAVGIEIGPIQCAVAWLKARYLGVGDKVRIRPGNFLKADLSAAQVVYAYLTSTLAERLQNRLAAQLQPGTRVVTISFDLPGWQPAAFDNEGLIFLYRMPPAKPNSDPVL